MRLLFVGGTSFVGRHAVEAAVAAQHDVTVFHRGRTNADLFAGVIEHRRGDRDTGDYRSLDDGTAWDAVVDVSAYVPRAVHQLADVLAACTGHYVHISSISAYDLTRITPDEDSPLRADLEDATIEDVTDESYGPLKAMCERAALRSFGEARTSIVRPTVVAGPHDHTDRFTYWARRMARGGDVAVAGPDEPMQVVDARDLGAFIVRLAETAAVGAFDGVGAFAPLAQFLRDITPAGTEARLVDVGREALGAASVELPMIASEPLPPAWRERPGTRAREAGFTARPIAETADMTRAWDRERGTPPLIVGPTADVEAKLVAAALG